jgi:putative transposase
MAAPGLGGLSDPERERALARYEVLRPHVEAGVPLARAAAAAGVPLRTAQR